MKGIILLLAIPLLIAATPLLAILILKRIKVIRESIGLAISVSLLTTIIGLGTTALSILVCANNLAGSMPADEPKCVTGAVVFLPIGLALTFVTFLVGLVFSIHSFKRRSSAS